MLINLYNGKQCHEYVKEYKSIIDIVRRCYYNRFLVAMVKETLLFEFKRPTDSV